MPRLREVYHVALRTGGDLRKMLEVLGVSGRALGQRLSLLRRLGVGRIITLYDPLALKMTYQTTAWVRTAAMTSAMIDDFEQTLREDASVASAQRVLGDYDYRIACFHESPEAAFAWVSAIRSRPEIADVRQLAMGHVFGHEMQGLVIWEVARRFNRGVEGL